MSSHTEFKFPLCSKPDYIDPSAGIDLQYMTQNQSSVTI